MPKEKQSKSEEKRVKELTEKIRNTPHVGRNPEKASMVIRDLNGNWVAEAYLPNHRVECKVTE